MPKQNTQFGQSLIEILFAISIFTVGVFTIGYLIIDTQTSLQKNIEFTQARLLAREGIEVVRTLRNDDFDGLAEGTYGLVMSDGVWGLSQDEPDETSKFTRFITIEDVNQKVKKITSQVVWPALNQIERNVTFESYVTNWTQDVSDASSLSFVTDAGTLSPDGHEITGLTVENTGPNEITLTEMIGEWDGTSTLQLISIDGVELFAVSSSSPSGAESGETIDIVDYVLLPDEGLKNVDMITFAEDMTGLSILFTFTLSDESTREVTLEF